MFFQMRRTVGACEKLHGAVIDHVGTNETRVFREVKALGAELKELGEQTLGAVTDAKAVIYFDWDNWWAIECSAGPNCDLKYKDEIYNYYQALYKLNIPVDIVGPEDDLGKYQLLIAPILYMTKTGYDEKIRTFVKNGGTFVMTFFSGIADEHDLIVTGGYPGKLRDIMGIWVEESDALPSGAENHFTYRGKAYPAKLLCDLSHLEGAEALSVYEEDFYAQMPAITKNQFGDGRAYYVATRSNEEFYQTLMADICEECGVESLLAPQENLEVTMRRNENGRFLFLLNHADREQETVMTEAGCGLLEKQEYAAGDVVSVPAKGVQIIRLQG